jgi:hypothetical protein
MDLLTPSARARENTVSVDEIREFNPSQGECCTASNFRLNLEGTASDSWNKSVTRVFVNNFLRTHAEYPGDNRVVRTMIQQKTTAAIKSLIKSYRIRNVGSPQLRKAQKKKNRRERKRTVSNSFEVNRSVREIDVFRPVILASPRCRIPLPGTCITEGEVA